MQGERQVFNTNKTLTALRTELAARGVLMDAIAQLQRLDDKSWLDQCAAIMLAQLKGEHVDSESITSVENNHAWARSIMKRNFLGLEEVKEHFGGKYTAKQRQKLAIIPFSEATLRARKDTHVLVAGYAMTINDIRAKVVGNEAKLFRSVAGEGWYNPEPFAAKAKVGVRWFLLRKNLIDLSTFKTYAEQLQLIPQGEENPWARDVVFATMLLYLSTGERLFEHVYVRCKDEGTGGGRVYVGGFDRGGLDIYRHGGGHRSDLLGVCSVQNS